MKYGFLYGSKLTNFTNARVLAEAVPYFIKHAIQNSEDKKIEPGKLLEAIQEYVNEYSENMLEMQMSDEGEVKYPIISLDEVADNLMNQGFLMVGNRNHDNRKVTELILAYMVKKGIKEYDGRSFVKSMELNKYN